MDTTTLILIVLIAVIVVAAIAWLMMRRRRSETLRSKFGPEYERAVDEVGDRRQAEAELHEREKRVKRFELRPLSAGEADRFVRDWRAVQSRFVDEPGAAIRQADDLLTDLMNARGYPVSDFDRRAADLSVDYGPLVHNYRVAHEVAERHTRGEAGTEDLRQAMIHYRDLFDELIGQPQQPEQRRAS